MEVNIKLDIPKIYDDTISYMMHEKGFGSTEEYISHVADNLLKAELANHRQRIEFLSKEHSYRESIKKIHRKAWENEP